MTRTAAAVTVLALALSSACRRGAVEPAQVDTHADVCARCRMAVSDRRFAGQLAAPGEEPRFFDDVGCLGEYLRQHPTLPAGTVAFVADHRTGAWVRASRAVFTKRDTLETPMGSHLIAHADAASRDADPAVAGGTSLGPTDVFGPAGPPDGAP
jgi:copper chaperone NosL